MGPARVGLACLSRMWAICSRRISSSSIRGLTSVKSSVPKMVSDGTVF